MQGWKVLKNKSYSERKVKRCHQNELLSLQTVVDTKTGKDWSAAEGADARKRCNALVEEDTDKRDIVYLHATGSIVQRPSASSAPFYVYELVVGNPSKGASPLPLATNLTCDHTTASVLHFLQAFETDLTKMYGNASSKRPLMIICDGSIVPLQAISWTFCRVNLEDPL